NTAPSVVIPRPPADGRPLHDVAAHLTARGSGYNPGAPVHEARLPPMVDPTPSDYHLTYLRERWDRDRSSRVFLQLAEEYRRRGLHSEALEVLETGLGFQPGYLAAQVALGRCRLEAGQPEVAIKVLDRVLTQDPTQAVATRLLAESWLQLGDEERAQAAI